MPGKWHEQRFTPDAARVEVACAECGKAMWLPKSKVAMYQRCGPECSALARRRAVEARSRPCETCGQTFTPRGVQVAKGQGRFCGQACNTAGRIALLAADVQSKAAERLREGYASGAITKPVGPNNARWMGGKVAYKQRRIASGADAAYRRRYRQANPDKVREFAQSRSRRQAGRLPSGTIKRLGDLQRWKCAICAISVRRRYHLDHVVPLARGGEHAPRNLQLLCPPCNVRKNAKDPIDHMRSLGRLL